MSHCSIADIGMVLSKLSWTMQSWPVRLASFRICSIITPLHKASNNDKRLSQRSKPNGVGVTPHLPRRGLRMPEAITTCHCDLFSERTEGPFSLDKQSLIAMM